ncbi:hypothetical protein TWF173_007179 [Orbilia oligospora]|uniref:Phospholipid scramblase n=3 Tax=Orbilia oligospora TaxID=2813651 RepID=G1XEX6_ARTOA|nr:hypothetical protein AOL_s00080g361 [Orbilia oligospora ATCC 24927]EGX48236.1 hypothetical protein AOL_s00080g361 [Orbilia oligospora ATCC 24927]KAF3282302.1 hypothetical protein TWF970_001713 [Orbilia oligospora]KAF3312378.1 hypothetical protein TWF173_007179 [Orbilia oligospora]
MFGKLKNFANIAEQKLNSIQPQGGSSMAGSSSHGGAQAIPAMEAVAAQVAIFPQFVAQKTEALVLKEKVFSLSGDSYDITTVEKVPVFKVQGKKLSFSGRKIFADQQGNELFHLRKEHLSIHTTYYGEDASGKVLFEVKSKFSIGTSKAYVNFTDVNGTAHSLLMKGNWFDTKSDIVDEKTGAVVASVNRKLLNFGELIGGQQTYVLTVAPGVDMALMCAACICFDEKNNEK